MNEKYIKALIDIAKITKSDKYFIVGSVALLSYTKTYGYDREIHDIDMIMETSEAVKITEKLKQLGYQQNTFINPRMPFYNKLVKFAENKYLRFSKDGVDIEILSTTMEQTKNSTLFEMYPGIKASMPSNVFAKSTYAGVEFRTVSKEMLYFFKKFANNTMGKKVKYKQEQRDNDINHLEKLIDKKKLNKIINLARLYLFGLPIKIPGFLLK